MLKSSQRKSNSYQPDSNDVPILFKNESQSKVGKIFGIMNICGSVDAVDKKYESKAPPVGVLMGQTGTGKTTLLNKMCGTNYAAGYGEQSMTRNLFKNRNNVGAGSFELIDTPGTDSQEETYKHAVQLREALTASDVNTIFVIVKYDNRHFKILENFLAVQAPVYQYERKVVVMVSHWDMSTNPKEESKNIMRLMSEYCSKFLFYSEKSNSAQIANIMYQFLSEMPREILKIPDQEFLLNFNIYKIKHSMIRDYLRYENELKRLEHEFSTLALSPEIQKKDRDEFIHSLIVSFSIESEKLLARFQKKYSKEMIELDYFVSWVKLQKECVQANDAFAKNMSALMSYDLNDKQDPRNMIKKCPGCHLIWFKTEGCNGWTSCGKRVSKSHDILEKGSMKFEFTRTDDGSYQWTKGTMAPIQKENLQGGNYNNRVGVGCGKLFWWTWAPKVEEEKILELFQAKTIDEIKQMLTNKDFVEQRKKVENEIDKQFHSTPIE